MNAAGAPSLGLRTTQCCPFFLAVYSSRALASLELAGPVLPPLLLLLRAVLGEISEALVTAPLLDRLGINVAVELRHLSALLLPLATAHGQARTDVHWVSDGGQFDKHFFVTFASCARRATRWKLRRRARLLAPDLYRLPTL